MKIKPRFLVWAISLLLVSTSINIVLFRHIIKLEEELQEYQLIEQQENEIQLCIRQVNPILSHHQAATMAREILANAKQNGVDRYLLTAVIWRESEFVPNAVSKTGDRGLCQFQPNTFQGILPDGNIDDWRDNIKAGAIYLRWMLEYFHGDPRLAVAAYNCGPFQSRDKILAISGNHADAVLARWNKLRERSRLS